MFHFIHFCLEPNWSIEFRINSASLHPAVVRESIYFDIFLGNVLNDVTRFLKCKKWIRDDLLIYVFSVYDFILSLFFIQSMKIKICVHWALIIEHWTLSWKVISMNEMTGTGTTFKDNNNNKQWSHTSISCGILRNPETNENQNEITRRFVMKKCLSHFFYLPSFTTSDSECLRMDQFSRRGSEKYFQLKRILHRKLKKSRDLWTPFDIHSFGITFKLQLEKCFLFFLFLSSSRSQFGHT